MGQEPQPPEGQSPEPSPEDAPAATRWRWKSLLPWARPAPPSVLGSEPPDGPEVLRPSGPQEPPEAGWAVTSDGNVVARLSKLGDDNLCLIRNISTAMAVAGLMLLARSIKLTTKFVRPSDIPLDFIRKNVKLRGRLRRITERGLELEHIPITIPLISRWKSQPYGILLIKIAGVELTDAGQVWLRNELRPYETLWFQLLARENSSLFCHLLVNRGMYFTVSLNEEILRRGLGRTILIKELDHNSKVYWTIHKNLLKAELEAVKTGAGIWKEETEKLNYVEKFKDSWREIWTKENPFKRRLSWRLNPEKESYYEKLMKQSEMYKDKVSNSTFLLKVREILSHVKLR